MPARKKKKAKSSAKKNEKVKIEVIELDASPAEKQKPQSEKNIKLKSAPKENPTVEAAPALEPALAVKPDPASAQASQSIMPAAAPAPQPSPKSQPTPAASPSPVSPPKTEASDGSKSTGIRPTGIKELDTLLGGGTPDKATVLLSGDAGVGKTTLAMQWLFEGFSQYNETGVYVTLTEPTTIAIQNLENKKFFNKEHIASSDMNVSQVESEIVAKPGIHFVDLRQILEEMNLLKTEYSYKDIEKIHDVLFKMIMNTGVSRVVIDSISAIAYLLKDKSKIRTFVYKMGKFLALSPANTLLIGEARDDRASVFGVEEFISDGLIRLRYDDQGKFPIRSLQVRKMRGIAVNSQPIAYKITDNGINLFLQDDKSLAYEAGKERQPTGVPGFDNLISGGLIKRSSVLVSGPSGSGKTLFMTQTMVAALSQGQKCLYLSFEESRDQILRNASLFGWGLEAYEEQKLLQIEAIHPDQIHLSELISKVKKIIKTLKPDTVIVDSLTAVENLYEEKDVHDWTSQLISLFKKHHILAMFSSATTNLVGESVASNMGISSLFDQIIMIRFVEIDSEFHHAVLIIKMRGSRHDKKMHRFVFNDHGLKVLHSFSGYEGIFSGAAKKISRSKEEQLNELFVEVLGPMGAEIFSEQKQKGFSEQKIFDLALEMADEGIINSHKKEEILNKSKSIFEGAA